MNKAQREAQIANALEVIGWQSLTIGELAAFVNGVADQSRAAGVAEGIRQAREAVAQENQKFGVTDGFDCLRAIDNL